MSSFEKEPRGASISLIGESGLLSTRCRGIPSSSMSSRSRTNFGCPLKLLTDGATHVAGAADIGAWIADNHDPPVGENVLEPDPAAAAAYDAAFALYRRRGESLFGGGER